MKQIFDFLRETMFAGIAISLGCIVYLTVGGIVGAVLFTFGLLTVVHYGVPLFTGKVGFYNILTFRKGDVKGTFGEWLDVALIIIGNFLGCLLTAKLVQLSGIDLSNEANAVMTSRTSLTHVNIFIRAIGCGLIMTTAVNFGKQKMFLPLLFGVPLFIMCGFLHSIADSFYYSYYSIVSDTMFDCGKLLTTFLGNAVGCNAYKLFHARRSTF